MNTARLEWPFLGYYGPQSGVRFSNPELDDYAESKEEFIELFSKAGELSAYDIAPDEQLDEYTGISEITAYWQAALEYSGGMIIGDMGNIRYSLSPDPPNKRWKLYVRPKSAFRSSFLCRGTLSECATRLIKKEKYKEVKL